MENNWNEVDEFCNDEIKKEVEEIIDWENERKKTNYKITKVKLNKLKEHPKNSIYNNLKDDDFDELKLSISIELQNPIIINKNFMILSGHRRFRAAKELNWIEIDTITKDFLTEDEELLFLLNENIYRIKTNIEKTREAREYREIENRKAKDRLKTNQPSKNEPTAKLPEAKRNDTGEVRNIVAAKVGLKPRTYGKLDDIIKVSDKLKDENNSKFLEDIANNSVDAAHKLANKPEEFIKQVKDKVDSGIKYKSITSVIKEVEKEKHFESRKEQKLPETIKIYNDDCRNILKDIPDNSIDCILTDPPYAIDFVSSWKANSKEEFNDSKDTIIPLLNDVCKLLQIKCKKDAHLYFFSSWMSYTYFEEVISKYFDISNVIIWEKNNTSLVDFDKRYGFSYEQIIFCKQKGNNSRMLKNKSSRDVIHFDRIANPDHTCEKPIPLLEYFIENSTIENELVVDLFAGTFNSMVAARKLKRNYIGVEIKNEFFRKGEIK